MGKEKCKDRTGIFLMEKRNVVTYWSFRFLYVRIVWCHSEIMRSISFFFGMKSLFRGFMIK